jgi:hypothetical protein
MLQIVMRRAVGGHGRVPILLLFVIIRILWAVEPVGEIYGTVRDVNQKPISRVRVTIANETTHAEAIAYTDGNGTYRITGLPLGYYSARASRSGLRDVEKRGLGISSTVPFREDLEMLSGSVGTWQTPEPGSLTAVLFGALVSALVLLLFTEPARYVFKQLWRTVLWFRDKWYEFSAPRFPDRIGLPGYRKRITASPMLARIENPVGPEALQGRISLEGAFAPISVTTGDCQDRIDLSQFAGTHNRFLVLGGPGTGKTTLMKNLVLRIAHGRSTKVLNDKIPILIMLREMASTAQTVDQAIASVLAGFRFKDPAGNRFINAGLRAGRLLIVLDGLDEVGAAREAVTTKIREFCNRDDNRDPSDNRRNLLIITCRENSYRTQDLQDVIPITTRVEPFAPQHMRTFLAGWPTYNGRSPLNLYSLIEGDPQILDICRNPLMLSILTGLFLENKRFDLPSSRDEFYRTSLDELLIQRPARRSITQLFLDTDKKNILQRISLDRLETLRADEDPEVLDRDRLFDFARQVLGDKCERSEFQELVRELVEVNGILKPVEGGYVLGHRTFQEYLAAREANRTREVSEAVKIFASRPELAEALAFYCGLLKNIPHLNAAMTALIRSHDPVIAGRCLLSASEIPSVNLVEQIVEMLFEPVRTGGTVRNELELLASLSQRQNEAFEQARIRFAEAIELVVGSNQDDAAGLITILSTRQDLAMRLIPALLTNASEARRKAAVTLLHDLGTEASLDELVRLVGSSRFPENALAAVYVANLIRPRNADVKARAALLPECGPDTSIWPFETYFPSRIALPVLHALRDVDLAGLPALDNPAISEALSIGFERRHSGGRIYDERRWRNVERYVVWNGYRRIAIRWFGVASTGIALVSGGVVVCLATWTYCAGKPAVVRPWPPSFHLVASDPVADLQRAAISVYSEVVRRYPPPPSRWWASLLENGSRSRKPSVPPNFDDLVNQLEELAFGENVPLMRDTAAKDAESLLGKITAVERFRVALNASKSRVATDKRFLIWPPFTHYLREEQSRLIIFAFGFLGVFVTSSLMHLSRWKHLLLLIAESTASPFGLGIWRVLPWAAFIFLSLTLLDVAPRPKALFAWIDVISAITLLFYILTIKEIPANRYMALVKYLQPLGGTVGSVANRSVWRREQ